jgi:integration host factor subunit beta
MTRSELIKKVADWSFEITHAQAERLVSIMLDEIIRAVDSGQRVELRGFGSFFPRNRKARMGRNPKTGEVVSVPARRIMFFTAGKDLKDRLNGKKAERRWTDER